MRKTNRIILSTLLGITLISPLSVDAKTLKHEEFINVAHRGASGYAPEHTFFAYDKGHYEIGADYIEIDLQMTKDGHLIALHDEKLDRTTNGTGLVKDHTLAEIKQLDAGSWFNEKYPEYANEAYVGAQVPTLDEVISRYGKNANYYIETKSPDVYPGMEEALLAVLDQHGLLKKGRLKQGHVLVQSFSSESLLKMHQLNSDVPLVQLTSKGFMSSATEATLRRIKTYADGFGPSFQDLTKENTTLLKSIGFEIHPYTVNKEEDMRRLNDYGVDGVFTNYPDVYERILNEK